MTPAWAAPALATPAPLHAESSGNGAPLVFWHGWAANLRVFDALRADLNDQWRTTAVDLPGHGRSRWDFGSAPADPQRLADQLLSPLLALLPLRSTLVGWSLGGQLALRAAALAPERVARLVLIGTTPCCVRAGDWPHGVDRQSLE